MKQFSKELERRDYSNVNSKEDMQIFLGIRGKEKYWNISQPPIRPMRKEIKASREVFRRHETMNAGRNYKIVALCGR